jgi:hypothetical protein
MAEKNYQVGELVTFTGGEWTGYAGIVSWPITEDDAGYVLVQSDGRVAGLRASHEDIKSVGKSSKGFTQLAYQLIKLSSFLIEKAIL